MVHRRKQGKDHYPVSGVYPGVSVCDEALFVADNPGNDGIFGEVHVLDQVFGDFAVFVDDKLQDF